MIDLEAINKKWGASVVILPPGGAVETVMQLVSEVERLRAHEYKDLAINRSLAKEIDRLDAEVERLRAQIDVNRVSNWETLDYEDFMK